MPCHPYPILLKNAHLAVLPGICLMDFRPMHHLSGVQSEWENSSRQMDQAASGPSQDGAAPTESALVARQNTPTWVHETPSVYAGLPARRQPVAGGTLRAPRREAFKQNPSLAKVKWHGGQAYEIEGLPHGPSYKTKDRVGQFPRRLIGASTLTSLTRVMSRRNADSPFHKKITQRDDMNMPLSDGDIDHIRRTTNAIAALVSLEPELGRHLKVEIVTGYDAGHLNFITPIVKGRTLQSFMDSPDLSAQRREELAGSVERLAPVLRELAAHGFVHGDINAGNLMHESETGRMVLIDFEKAKEFAPGEEARLRRYFDLDMENLALLAESMRRPPSQQSVTLQFVEQISSSHFDPAAIEGYSEVESSDDEDF